MTRKETYDSVTLDEPGNPKNVGKSLGPRAETLAKAAMSKQQQDRRTPRDRTGINPLDRIDKQTPYL